MAANPICQLCTHLDHYDQCSKPTCTPQTAYPRFEHDQYSPETVPFASFAFCLEEVRRLEHEAVNLKMKLHHCKDPK